jgi:hypothetical protein
MDIFPDGCQVKESGTKASLALQGFLLVQDLRCKAGSNSGLQMTRFMNLV